MTDIARRDAALTTAQAAAQLGMRPQTLEKWRATRTVTLPYIKVGRAVRYLQSDIDAFVSANVHGAEAQTA